MNYIIKNYYDPYQLIYTIVISLPDYIILNKKFVDFLRRNERDKLFTIDSLLSMYEYVELFCWSQMKEKISKIFSLEIEEMAKEHIMNYFGKKENANNIINKKNFTEALRKLISRYLIGTKQEFEFGENNSLNLYITKYEFWKKEITFNDNFEALIRDICPNAIKISNCKRLYDLLDGDKYIFMEGVKEEENKQKENKIEEIKIEEDDDDGERNFEI